MARRPKRRTIEQAFGEALRDARGQRELSQEELGFRSGAHRTYISELERGVKCPTLDTVNRLAEALQMKASELVRDAEQKLG